MQIHLDINSVHDYQLFLKIKSLPAFKFQGRTAIIPDEYQHLLMPELPKLADLPEYKPLPCLFDYQRDISRLAIYKEKFALFMVHALRPIFRCATHQTHTPITSPSIIEDERPAMAPLRDLCKEVRYLNRCNESHCRRRRTCSSRWLARRRCSLR